MNDSGYIVGAIIGGVIASYFIITGLPEPLADKYRIVKSGDCYSYRSGGWVNSDCFSSKEDAQTDMNNFISFQERIKSHQDRKWQDIK